MSPELSVSPLSRRRKISVASSKILFFTTGQAAASTGLRGTMPYGTLMNGKRPEAKPTVSRRFSSRSSPCSARNVRIRSAAAIGPPLQRMFMIAEPMPMRFVRANTRWRELQDVSVEPDLADEVGDHRAGIGLLHFRGEMAFRHPSGAESQLVRELDLFEEILEHRPLVRQIAIHLGLADGEEDVELHEARYITLRT